MFLFDNLSGKSAAKLPQDLFSKSGQTAAAKSLLIWEEHCVECAAPACYSTCDLYSPTANGKCRRFESGIQELLVQSRSLAHISYRKWGKLEARGSALQFPISEVRQTERMFSRLAKIANHIGSFLNKIPQTRKRANLAESLLRRLAACRNLRSEHLGVLPTKFVGEIFNPGNKPIMMQLAMIIDQNRLSQPIAMSDQPRPFRTVWTLNPGMNRVSVPSAEFSHIVGSGLPFLVQLTSFDEKLPEIVIGELDFVTEQITAHVASPTTVHGAAKQAPAIKCVVFDLDNTLWEGVLLEGPVNLRPEVRKLFDWLDERGILISIASKNAENDALERLSAFGLDKYLLHPQINWEPKSLSVKRIASLIDIGVDTLLFIDDNPFERAQVGEVLPEVEVLPETCLADLTSHPRLQGGVTPESRRRRIMYQEAAARQQAAEEFTDYHRFLADCQIVLEIRPDRPSDLERIAELVQRTNQLNFSGRKYDRETIKDILEDRSRDRFVVDARDRFGSYGTVGFCLASRVEERIIIEDFMLSCRVQGKYVEQALFDYLAKFYDRSASEDNQQSDYPSQILVNFKPTARNAAALKVLTTLGFEAFSDCGYSRLIKPGALTVDFLTVNPSGDKSSHTASSLGAK